MALLAKGKPDYGLDSPALVRNVAILGGVTLAAGFLLRPPQEMWFAHAPLVSAQWCGLMCAIVLALLLRSSYVGKLKARDEIIASIGWRGDERVLDVGCGRGLFLLAAAKHLTAGKAIGVDVWRAEDLSDNWAEAAWDNARAEGVEDNIEIQDADARELPFEKDSFDIVLSSLTVSIMTKPPDRRRAIEEMARVLKPGGRLIILDTLFTGEYAKFLRGAGFREVTRSGLRLGLFPPARVLSAVK